MKSSNLNTYLADTALLNIKIHNLHWNVVGREFKAIHKLTEKIYKELQEQFDTVAEIMKMQGELPSASMADYMEQATLEEIESRDYSVSEVLEILAEDCEKIIDLALDIRHEADEEDNFMVVNLFEDYLAKFYKTSWMIQAMLAEEDDIDIAQWEEIPMDEKPKKHHGKKGKKEK